MTITINARFESEKVTFTIEPGEWSLGRSQQAHLQVPSHWSIVSGIQLRIRLNHDGSLLICDGNGKKDSTNGTRLNNRYISSSQWQDWEQQSELQIGSNLRSAIRIEWLSVFRTEPPSQLGGGEITIGRSEQCSVRIEGPTISRVHCIIKKVSGLDVIEDKSINGIYLNDKRVKKAASLREGDQIKVGTYVFGWIGGKLQKETSGANYRIDVRDLWLPGRIAGSSLSIEPGQLVAFVGGSGAGKSSLLTTIVGQNMDYRGNIYVNGGELRDCYSSIKQEVGFVPQDDIVHKDLTVEEVLRYSARLKLPDPEQRRKGVERVLSQLEMTHRRSARVKELSGGQRKRVSIGVELIADPRILFLDEPTSGLDPGLDKRMMQLLRHLADSGKTVALVTHATNNVMLCDQVVFLGRGGHLCYAGAPEECANYFGVKGDFADIYQYLEKDDSEIADLASRYRSSSSSRLPNLCTSGKPKVESTSVDFQARLQAFPSQLKTLVSRDIRLQSRDVTSLVLNAVTAPLATVMIAIAANNRSIFADYDELTVGIYPDALRILFVVVCSTIWVGLSTSLQTIVKERSIFIRERAFNLLPEAYLFSKTLVMLGQALAQAFLVAASVVFLFDAPQSVDNWFLSLWLIFFATLFSIGSQALLVSSLVQNSQQASSIAPLLLIPQLVFGGVLFILGDGAKDLYSIVTSRWSMRALGAVTEITNLIPGGRDAIDHVSGAIDYEPIRKTIVESMSVLSVQALILIIATLLSLLFYPRNR
ncbi:ATP-binding cassette domain-containing protein [Vulcanococcus limneticus]|uniref:ATP-binding cassette domain-containing protein n=1 Tax=Vulcanococcus limneticus TaxID=2170428 RepID=UPI00398C07CA